MISIKRLVIVVISVSVLGMVSSCGSSKGGCYATGKFVGYGRK